MKNPKFYFLLVILFFIGFKSVYAQNTQPTPYQKKQLELSKKWFQILTGYSMTMTDEVFYEQLAAGKEANDFVLGLAIFNYASTHSKSQSEKVFTQMGNEYKQAEKLKNATDFRLEKEAQARKLQIEKEKKLQVEQEAYAKTDIGSILKNIKGEFEKWNQKGEFEKEVDYTERLRTQSKTAFEDICIKQIKNRIENYNNEYNLKKELSIYNSENEYFIITFKINGVEWQTKLNVPISQAQDFKNNFSNFRFEIDGYDWGLVENSLSPTLVTLKNQNTKYQFPLSLQNQSDISISYDDFEIENQHLKGYIFKYSNAKAIAEQIEKEKQRLDSLELATYNQHLDSIFNDYNSRLLKNKYNLEKETLTDYNKVTGKSDREYNFNRSISSMKSKFESLNNNFEHKRKNEYRKNENLFANENEFDNSYTKGKDSYQTEVERKTVLNYLIENSQFVESMDFQKEKKESVGSTLGRGVLNVATNMSMSAKDYTNENKVRKNILFMITECKDKPYYSQILDLVIENNKGLNKEWTKNGQFFENKTKFYNAYLSDDYKKILKENKKNN